MAVAVKKVRPTAPNISQGLGMISPSSSINSAPVSISQETQSGAPVQTQPVQQQVIEPQAVHQPVYQTEQVVTQQTQAQPKKSFSKDTQIILRTTEENKNYLKGFFASYGLTLSKGIQLSCAYLESQIKAGSVEINSAGLITNKR